MSFLEMPFAHKLFMQIKMSLRVFLFIVMAFTVVPPVDAYDQPWNGGKEDITGPTPPPPPPCPSGNCQCPPNGTGSPVYLADGSLVWSDVDITFASATRVGLKRTYNSFDYRAGLFGRGWVTAQESNIARTYKAITEGNADGSPKTATDFKSVPIWLASYGRRYTLEETSSQCTTPDVLYFTFEKMPDGGFKQVYEDSNSFDIYSAGGVLQQSYSDEDGTTVYYEYDDQDRLVKQYDSYNFTLNYVYNEQGFVTEVKDQANRVWRYSYNEFGSLTQVLDPDGNSRDYVYQLVDNIGYKQHLLTDVNDNTNDPVLKVSWASRTIGVAALMRVSSYTESDGHRHDYSYSATTYNGVAAIRVVKDTKQVGSNTSIETRTYIADANNYQVLSDVNNTDNLTENSRFDARGNLVEETDERGNVTLYEYNAAGRRVKTTELAGTTDAREITVSYWNNSDREAVVNEYGIRETRYTYDNNLRLLSHIQVDLTNNQQRISTYTYYPNALDSQANIVLGKVASIDGPQTGTQDTQSFEYNAQGLLTKINYPLNQSVSYSYNAAGQQITETDVNGIVTEMTYDSRNRLLQTIRNSRTFQFAYNVQGLMVLMIDELGRATQISYDEQNQPIRTTYPSGDYMTFGYVYSSSYTEVTRHYYQSDDTLISTQITRNNPDSKLAEQTYLASLSQQVTQNQYNGLDDLTQKTLYGQFGSATTSIFNYSYDKEGRLEQIRDDFNGNTNTSYDNFDRLTRVTDPNNGTTQYAYTAWGELIQLISSDTGTTNYQNDESGNVTQQINSLNQQVNYSYDALNRITKIDYAGDNFDTTFTYDEGQYGKGLLTSVTDGSGSSQYQYDDRGLLTQANSVIAGTSLNVNYNYSQAEELTQITYPSGAQVLINYDAAGRLAGIQLNDNGTNTSILNNTTWKGEKLASYEYGNGLSIELIYDNAGRLTEKGYGGNDIRLQNQLDNQNQILQQIWSRNGTQDINDFQYDSLGRLTQDGSAIDNLDWLFSYDATGNRLVQQKSDNSETNTYSYLANTNLLEQVNSTTIQRDDAGNTLDDGSRQYQYNAMNRLEQLFNTQSSIQAIYSYNYQGQRLRKQLSGNLTGDIRYVYGLNGELLGEYDANGNHIREYIYHEDASLRVSGAAISEEDEKENIVLSLVAVINSDNSIYYVNTDHLATPRQATDKDQVVVWSWDSDGFGYGEANDDPDLNNSIVTINHRFPGQYYDIESGLHYNFFRYYDPDKGRYITSDPIGISGNLNTFSYASSNPLNDFDQHGLVCGTGLCVAVVVTVGRVAIVGWRTYRTYKKAKKARKRLCSRIYSVYAKACKIPCKGITGCKPLTFAAAAAETCVTGRKTYVAIGCDSVFPTRRDHPGEARKAANALKNCKNRRDKACRCP